MHGLLLSAPLTIEVMAGISKPGHGVEGVWTKKVEGKWLRYHLRNINSQQGFTVLLKKDMRFPELDILCAMHILVDK